MLRQPLVEPLVDVVEGSGVSTAPVRILSLRDAARLAMSRGMSKMDAQEDAKHGVQTSFVSHDPVDHPWCGRRETWHDYLLDLPHWRCMLYFDIPLHLFGTAAVTIGLGMVVGGAHSAAQASALSAPISAFSLLTSLILTFRHSIAYSRFWDCKNFTTSMLSSLRFVAFSFQNSSLDHRQAMAAMCAALMDGYIRSINERDQTNATLFQRSPPGPWRENAISSLPPKLLRRLALTPGSLVATVAAEIATSPAMNSLDGCLRGAVLAELQNITKMSAAALAMGSMPVIFCSHCSLR